MTMTAVKNNRVYYVDDRIESPSPVAFDALEDLANNFIREIDMRWTLHLRP